MTRTLAEPPAGQPEPRHTARRRAGVGSAVVGVVGELLITLGLLLGLYVVWQLWWTDVEAAGVQAELSEQLNESFSESPDQVGDALTPLAAEAAPVELPPLEGATFARLWVPDWGSDSAPYVKAISEGVDRQTVLDVLGIGHYPDTAMPGELGNFALAGHRQSHGKPFYNIDTLAEGDALIVETSEAWYVYRVSSYEIVPPSEVSVIAANPADPGAAPEVSMITLTTCHPLFTTRERYIVHGILETWMPRESGRPAELVGVDL